MPTQAKTVDDWYLDDLDAQEEYQDVRSDGVVTVKQQCLHITLSRARKLVGLTQFTPDVGLQAASLPFKSGPNTPQNWDFRGKMFVCSRDKIGPIDSVTGECSQSQVWEYYSDWEDVPDTKWKATDPKSAAG